MISTQQGDVISFLSSAAAHGGQAVERVETHASIVFLSGSRAWKLKRAVRYDYLDFSTLERRQASCEAEVRINRRTAPAIYLGVVAVTREQDGSLALGGSGTPVDWVIEMVRFDQEQLLDRLAAKGTLDRRVMRPLARAVAGLHRQAERRMDQGGHSGMEWVVEGNATDLSAQTAALVDPRVRDALIEASREALARHGPLLDARRDEGWIRQCHGDLHLRNIVLLDGTPTLFDAVEFNDRIACIDVLYDVAFLLMDLWKRHLPQHANAVWNGYLPEMDEYSGIPALPLFLSCRAAVRAKTSLAAAGLQQDARRAGDLRALSREYLDMALRLLRPAGPCLVAVGGYSGTGKSSLAYEIAPSLGPVPGAVVLRSDVVRKRLLGVPSLARLDDDGYTEEVSARVYHTLAERAATIARAGHGVIVDAVFGRASDRQAIERTARELNVPFLGLWLEAPAHVLLDRVRARTGDASDADVAVVRRQLASDHGPLTWHRIDASPPLARVAAQVTDIALPHLRREAAAPTEG